MKQVWIIGTGTGSTQLVSPMAAQAMSGCQQVFGSKRLLEPFDLTGKEVSSIVSAQEICEQILSSEWERFGVAVSGDTGFYSLASRLTELLSDCAEVSCIPAVSSFQYMLARLCKPWQEVATLSLHGREKDIVPYAMNADCLFVLAGGKNSPQAICKRLSQAGMDFLKVWVGERLSYPEEKITYGSAEQLAEQQFDSLSVLYIENPCYRKRPAAFTIQDDEFIRGKVPMTKAEVRTLSLAKLELQETDILYDIGAGTGSVGIQAALWLRQGSVYAIEKNPKACELIVDNRKKFGAYNLWFTLGEAPEQLRNLPKPDCAFIGGSSGSLREILTVLLEKNPSVRVVVNTVSLEGLTEALNCLNTMNFTDIEITAVNISKARQAGRYHLMTAQNPVHILSAKGRAE